MMVSAEVTTIGLGLVSRAKAPWQQAALIAASTARTPSTSSRCCFSKAATATTPIARRLFASKAKDDGSSIPTPGGVDPSGGWQAEFELEMKRRRELAEKGRPKPAGAESELDGGPTEEQREEMQRGAAQLEVFAYPTNRTTPWATISILAASGCLTLAASLYWRFHVCRAITLEELEGRSEGFAELVEHCSVGKKDLEKGELHRLVLASLLRADEGLLRSAVAVTILGCCGTLLERLQGSNAMLSVVVGGTIVSSAGAAYCHTRTVEGAVTGLAEDGMDTSPLKLAPPRVTALSGGVTALGTLCALRFGRWAAIPGLPLPVSWLMAPVLVSAVSSFFSYGPLLHEYQDAVKASLENIGPDGLPKLEVLRASVLLAGCEALEDRTRADCLPQSDEVVGRREALEEALVRLPPPPPDGAFFADIIGALVGVVAAIVLKRSL